MKNGQKSQILPGYVNLWAQLYIKRSIHLTLTGCAQRVLSHQQSEWHNSHLVWLALYITVTAENVFYWQRMFFLIIIMIKIILIGTMQFNNDTIQTLTVTCCKDTNIFNFQSLSLGGFLHRQFTNNIWLAQLTRICHLRFLLYVYTIMKIKHKYIPLRRHCHQVYENSKRCLHCWMQ